MKKGYLAAAALLLFLTGCGGNKSYSYHPDQSSIFISGDGTLKSALVEEIDTEAKSDGLESFANAEIEDFNKLNADNQVKLEDAAIKKNVAKLVFSYSSFECMKEFAKFTQDNSFDLNSVEVYKLSDIDVSKMDSIEIPDGIKGNYIAVIDGKADVYTEGKITYVSNDIEFDDNTAKVDGFNYIIFK
jgi:lipoprotein